MLVFVTGATGFVGSAVIRDLIGAGHRVRGLARSEEGVQALLAAGAEPHRGTLEDLASLRSGAAGADAVIHLGFIHDFSKFQENCEVDRLAIEALGESLVGSNRRFLVTGGLGGLIAPGQVATENDLPLTNLRLPRVSEPAAMSFVPRGVCAAVVRLPQVHDTVKHGLVSYLIDVARRTGVSAYVGDGSQGWAAAHISDVARLYRLALERPEPGGRYHAVAEEGVPLREIAEAIGRGLQIPVVSISPEEAPSHFGWLGTFTTIGMRGSSAITREKFGWNPEGPGLLTDLANRHY